MTVLNFNDIDNWHLERWGKFTSSEKYKLLSQGKYAGIFGAGAVTYIKSKALEMATDIQERPELEESKSILWGRAHEYSAYEWYVNQTRNYSMQFLGTETPCFIPDPAMLKESGGSPDGIFIEDGKIVAGIEIKCPKVSLYHFDRLIWKDQWDLKEGYTQCYAQIQDLLRITGAKVWHFVSFDDRQKMDKNKGKIIEVYPDAKFQDDLLLRTQIAVKEKYKIYENHINRSE